MRPAASKAAPVCSSDSLLELSAVVMPWVRPTRATARIATAHITSTSEKAEASLSTNRGFKTVSHLRQSFVPRSSRPPCAIFKPCKLPTDRKVLLPLLPWRRGLWRGGPPRPLAPRSVARERPDRKLKVENFKFGL